MPAEERRIILKHVDDPEYTVDLDCYLRHGGYAALKQALAMKPEEIRSEVEASGLRGRGGAGFPCGMKWKFVDRRSGKPIYLICNADESEPGSFKDRKIIHSDPHQLIEGMMISAYANDCVLAFIYIREEFPKGARILEKAIAEAREQGFVGDDMGGSGYGCNIIVHRGAGAYICGEETALIESLEGKRPYPRIKPPFYPATLGLYHCPTIVNNVETLCNVCHIVAMGGEAYAKIGRPNNSGTRIWCLSGHVQRPGLYEVEKVTIGEMINELCGGMRPGRQLKAVIPGGGTMKILRADERFQGKLPDGTEFDWAIDDIPLDFDGVAAAGSQSGSAGMMVLDDTTDIPEALANINAFYAHESCGQCTPCREGSLWVKQITQRMCSGGARKEDVDLLLSIAGEVGGRTICPFGFSITWPVESYIGKFREEFEAKADQAENENGNGEHRLIER